MPITGTDAILKASAKAAALTVLNAKRLPGVPSNGVDMVKKTNDDLADAIGAAVAAVITHFASNAQVMPGIPVSTVGGPSSQTGTTIAPGKLL